MAGGRAGNSRQLSFSLSPSTPLAMVAAAIRLFPFSSTALAAGGSISSGWLTAVVALLFLLLLPLFSH